jgi:hypothetical protein
LPDRPKDVRSALVTKSVTGHGIAYGVNIFHPMYAYAVDKVSAARLAKAADLAKEVYGFTPTP